jgi:hypothetical protein
MPQTSGADSRRLMGHARGTAGDHALGCGRRLYRRANSNRPRNRSRQASCNPADRRSAFGRWRDVGKDKSMTCVTDARDR